MTAPFAAGTSYSGAHGSQFGVYMSTPTSAGDDLVLLIAVPAAGLSISNVLESENNTYTQQALITTGATVGIYTALDSEYALGADDYIQVTFSSNTTGVLLALIDCATWTVADQSGTGDGTGTGLSVSSAGGTSVPGELVLSVLASAVSQRSFTSPSGTQLATSPYGFAQYQTLATAGTASASVTAASAGNWAAALLTLEPSVVPAPILPRSAPLRGKTLAVPRGRGHGSAGIVSQAGPPVYPLGHPAGLGRRPPPVRKGRSAGLTRGAPVAGVQSGPAILPQGHPAGLARRAPGPVRKGRARGSAGAPVTAPSSGPVIYPQGHPAGLGRRAPGPVRKGRGRGSPVPLASSAVPTSVNAGAFMASLP